MGEATDEFLLLFGDEDISIHASRGGSDKIGRNWVIDSDISIHASRGGSDDFSFVVFPYSPVISIHASRGGSDPLKRRRISILQTISIHASRGGSDYSIAEGPKERFDFNPRFPWGKRLCMKALEAAETRFQSTLPVGEATRKTAAASRGHAYFNPRFPWGKRHRQRVFHLLRPYFNPRFPWGKRR